MDVKRLMKQGIASANAGQKDKARSIFNQVVAQDPQNLTAWLWLSDLASNPGERASALEHALRIDPNQPLVQKRLDAVKQELAPDQDEVVSDFRKLFLDQAGSFTPAEASGDGHVLEAGRLAAENHDQGSEALRPGHQALSPSRLIIRISSGPILLYFILVLVLGGINFLTVDLVLALGTLLVIPGSLLLTLAIIRPTPAPWMRFFHLLGRKHEGWMHFIVGLVGVILMIVPYTVLILNIIARVELLRLGRQ